MKFRCQLCTYRCQFPYQLKAHHNTHIQTNEFQCKTCGKNFASKGSKEAHVKTHTTRIICPDCPSGTSKTYTSNNAFRHHKRGKHGPGWTAPCGAHFQWKSKYNTHVKIECTTCKDIRAQIKCTRFPYLNKIKREKMNIIVKLLDLFYKRIFYSTEMCSKRIFY